ncbi:MAG: hypothetical protein M3362_08585 [Acidobacteriota bacterium]|nr:hypothetical protein [Acidobacteriota bacterium]
MAKAWVPKNQVEANKRQAGRRKLHIRKRAERAARIERLLAVMPTDENMRVGSYGWTRDVAQVLEVSEPTASRDLRLCRAILNKFEELFEREYDPETDSIKWGWDYASFSFRTPETVGARHEAWVMAFMFSTR